MKNIKNYFMEIDFKNKFVIRWIIYTVFLDLIPLGFYILFRLRAQSVINLADLSTEILYLTVIVNLNILLDINKNNLNNNKNLKIFLIILSCICSCIFGSEVSTEKENNFLGIVILILSILALITSTFIGSKIQSDIFKKETEKRQKYNKLSKIIREKKIITGPNNKKIHIKEK